MDEQEKQERSDKADAQKIYDLLFEGMERIHEAYSILSRWNPTREDPPFVRHKTKPLVGLIESYASGCNSMLYDIANKP